jgi:MYXO-CTERM domain-containing protein
MRTTTGIGSIAAVLATLCTAQAAHAFCGFYVAGNDQPMFNDATQVVLMRKGTRTVLSMQNNYKGPPQDFAMVIPVPVVLHEGDVKTLPKTVFEDVERMSAPRLVEYWEQDPCRKDEDRDRRYDVNAAAPMAMDADASGKAGGYQVTVEARFTVGEYQIEILSAKDSTGLDAWLRDQHYKIPSGAEPLLRPYVESNSKWFVAKIDPSKVKFEGNRAALSPLRFHYDSDEFTLPIRLGLANSSGTQDLIVNILAPQQRYEVANYKNVTIPTNLDVRDQVKGKFGAFYAALFDATVEKNPGAVVTEYSWAAGSCDPCPGPTLQPDELETLGLDVIDPLTPEQLQARDAVAVALKRLQAGSANQSQQDQQALWAEYNRATRLAPQQTNAYELVLTRLHARYGKSITNDLVFKTADGIVGGREHVIDPKTGKLEEGAQSSPMNNFQARYAIRHPWTGAISCLAPKRGVWGGPPSGQSDDGAQPALGLAFAERGAVALSDVVVRDVPEIGLKVHATGCGCQSSDPAGLVGCLVFGALGFFRPRRRSARQ